MAVAVEAAVGLLEVMVPDFSILLHTPVEAAVGPAAKLTWT